MPTSEPSNRRRSERVMLQMRIRVKTEMANHAHVEEDTTTLVVNAHGGLMKMKAELLVGQPIVLINPHNQMKESCRVVRVEQPTPEYFTVAFEFSRPSPKFWPVVFPPADWGVPATK